MVAHCGWSVAGNQRLQLDRIRFETVWAFVQEWLTEEPTATAKELFQRVQASMPGLFTDAQLITLSAPSEAVASRDCPSPRIGSCRRYLSRRCGLRTRAVEMTACGKPGKPRSGFSPFLPPLEIALRFAHRNSSETPRKSAKPKPGFPLSLGSTIRPLELKEKNSDGLSFKDSAKGRWVRLDLSNSVSR
jgi:hypothetical protein